MYFHERPEAVSPALLHIFILLFPIAYADDVSFYFSLTENRAIKGVQFISSVFADDIMICARACARELKCSTANYMAGERQCELSKERMENISSGATMVILKGCHLIAKVIFLFANFLLELG